MRSGDEQSRNYNDNEAHPNTKSVKSMTGEKGKETAAQTKILPEESEVAPSTPSGPIALYADGLDAHAHAHADALHGGSYSLLESSGSQPQDSAVKRHA